LRVSHLWPEGINVLILLGVVWSWWWDPGWWRWWSLPPEP